MKFVIETESTLTDRYQTTVPTPVRQALGLGKRDRIQFRVREDGTVLMARAPDVGEANDPALAPFLGFLAKDMQAHPERLRVLPPALINRLSRLTKGVEVDLDAPLDPDNA